MRAPHKRGPRNLNAHTARRLSRDTLIVHRVPDTRRAEHELAVAAVVPLAHRYLWLFACVSPLSSLLPPSSPRLALTNAGGTVSDIWSFRERGLASAIYATVPFLGPSMPSSLEFLSVLRPPVVGPVIGGFVAQNHHLGWRFNFWLIFIFAIISLTSGYLFTPETVCALLLDAWLLTVTVCSSFASSTRQTAHRGFGRQNRLRLHS